MQVTKIMSSAKKAEHGIHTFTQGKLQREFDYFKAEKIKERRFDTT